MDTFDRDKKAGSRVDRRTFLKVSGAVGVAAAAGGLEGILAAQRAPAYAQGTKLHWVRWVDFIPEADVELKRQMPEASKALGAEVTLETINANDLQPRITAAIQSGSGADIFMFQYNWAHLYQNAVVDVSDVANEVAKAQGGFYPVYTPSCRVGTRWLAVPHSIIGNAVAYRRSWLKEIGVTDFPKTWEDARKVFTEMKKKGKPYGQTLGHTFGDAPTFTYPMLWCYGGAETDPSGKKVVISTEGAVGSSVKFMQAFWKDACDEGGLAWDDTNNNRAFHAGEISATLNGASIYIVAKRKKDQIKDEKGEPMWQDIDHAPLPAGPAGPFLLFLTHSHAVMKYSKNQKLAKEFIRWYMDKKQYEPWFIAMSSYMIPPTRVWFEHAAWTKDPKLTPFRDTIKDARHLGYAGPPSAKASEALAKYLILDMFAKAIQGTPPEESLKWATAELKKIYSA